MASSAGSGTRLQLGSTRSPMLGTVGDSMAPHANWSFLVEKSRAWGTNLEKHPGWNSALATQSQWFPSGDFDPLKSLKPGESHVLLFAQKEMESDPPLSSPAQAGTQKFHLPEYLKIFLSRLGYEVETYATWRDRKPWSILHILAQWKKNLESSCNLLQPAADTRIAWTVRRWCPTSACSNERMISLLSGVLFAYPFLHLLRLILGQTIYLRVTIVIAMTIVGL